MFFIFLAYFTLYNGLQFHSSLYMYLYFLTASKGASPVAQTLKNLPTMQEAWIQSLGQEDPLEKGMATHSSILAWRIPWIEEPGKL